MLNLMKILYIKFFYIIYSMIYYKIKEKNIKKKFYYKKYIDNNFKNLIVNYFQILLFLIFL